MSGNDRKEWKNSSDTEWKKRKNVSLTKESLIRLSPLLKLYKGNFSMMMRDIVDFTLFAVDNCGSMSRARSLIYSQATSNDLQLNDQIIMQVVKVIRCNKVDKTQEEHDP